jgi:hypothetical protein
MTIPDDLAAFLARHTRVFLLTRAATAPRRSIP